MAENARNKNNFIFLPMRPHPFPDTRWEFSILAFILPLLPPLHLRKMMVLQALP
jgi:hypothetical protein